MRTITDAEDAVMSARFDVDKAHEEFVKEFYKPMVDTMMAAMWQQMPDLMKIELAKRVSPEALKMFDKMYGGKK